MRLEQELKGFEDRKTLLPSTAHLPAARRPNPPPLLSAAVQENEGPRGGPRAQTAPPMESSEADALESSEIYLSSPIGRRRGEASVGRRG